MNYLKSIFLKLSRIIYHLIPIEFKNERQIRLKRILYDNLADETFNHFKENIKSSLIFESTEAIREYAIKTSLLNDKECQNYYLEFGVYNGVSANFFSKYVNKLYVFDSFEGIREDFVGTPNAIGTMNLDKKIPKLNSNVIPNVGWVEDTLDIFLKKHNPKINFLHLDLDTYSPTKFTLEKVKPYLAKNAIIIFDELYNYFGWKHGEYKALNEVFNKDEFEYKAFEINGCKVAIQIK